jgi:ABC-type branched-subunit amino acid transport system ATPase component
VSGATGTLLELRDVSRAFGGVAAVDSVSLAVEEGEVVGLIGPNGAGKTTLFDSISGLQRIDTGSVSFAGQRIDNRRVHRIARSGLARTMQTGGVFADLTVAENLKIAGRWTSVDARELPSRSSDVLDLVGLAGREPDAARQLSYGQQRLLEFGMALMGNPRLILLDEPVAGVNPLLVEQIQRIVTTLNKNGTTFVIVEHNVPFVAAISTRVVAMARGRIIAEGTADAVRADPDVLEHYLTGS